MKLPDLSEEDQEPKPKSDEQTKGAEQSLPDPKVVVNRKTATRHPTKTGKEPDSKIGGKTSSRPTTRSRLQSLVSSWPDHPTDTSPDSPHQTESQQASPSPSLDQGVPQHASKDNNPGRRLHAFEAAAKKAPPIKIPWKYRMHPTRETTHRAYWDVTTTFSLIINAILVGLLLIMATQIKYLKTTMTSMLGGLYGNFVKIDQASINTTITVNAQLPLDFSLPVSQNTEVVLNRDVSIPGAHVVINTGVLNINTQANITLPAGTTLPIALNLNIPVQSTIPISLQVPVNIPLSQTGLHEPITGLQTSLRPLYCMFNKDAQYPEGIYICTEHGTPTPGNP